MWILALIILAFIVYIKFMQGDNNHKPNTPNHDKITSDKLLELCTVNYETIIINNPGGMVNTLSRELDEPHTILFQVRNNPSFINFKNAIKDLELSWTKNGDSNLTVGKIKYEDFLNEIQSTKTDKYIFDINTEYNENVKRITEFIPCPDLYFLNKESPNVSIYAGVKNTGTKIHHHHEAVNYLILGKKIWIIFPKNENNAKLCTKEFRENSSSINWLFSNIKELKNKIDGLSIFVQHSGEIVFIPKRFYHGAINLENSHGFVYSSTIL
jgi:hypothetical protein